MVETKKKTSTPEKKPKTPEPTKSKTGTGKVPASKK